MIAGGGDSIVRISGREHSSVRGVGVAPGARGTRGRGSKAGRTCFIGGGLFGAGADDCRRLAVDQDGARCTRGALAVVDDGGELLRFGDLGL